MKQNNPESLEKAAHESLAQGNAGEAHELFRKAGGQVTEDGMIFKPDFFQSIYLSIITIATVGYGDITPVGVTRFVAIAEALAGIFIVPVFIVGLSRKFLRT